MQLNPARGRKLYHLLDRGGPPAAYVVYAAQPREGTETKLKKTTWASSKLVYAAQPREGTETGHNGPDTHSEELGMVYAAQPREGTETSTPPSSCGRGSPRKVYAAQPREGTETAKLISAKALLHHIGLCSSTPRGDGNLIVWRLIVSSFLRGLCSSTPRGDGNKHHKDSPR